MNVWASIPGNTIIQPLFIEENVTGEIYFNLFEEIGLLIKSNLEDQIDAVSNMILKEYLIYFQQDGPPPHSF